MNRIQNTLSDNPDKKYAVRVHRNGQLMLLYIPMIASVKSKHYQDVDFIYTGFKRE